MYKFLFLIAFVSWTVVAYDFKDSDFSKFLGIVFGVNNKMLLTETRIGLTSFLQHKT